MTYEIRHDGTDWEFLHELTSFQVKDGLAIWTLKNAEHGNALGEEISEAAQVIVKELLKHPETVRAILLRGEGANFSFGGDLGAMRERLADLDNWIRDVTYSWHNTLAHLWRLDIPIVGEALGYTMGGGLGLLAACDVIVAGESSKFGSAFANLGFSCDSGSSVGLTWRMGPARARRFTLLSEIIDSAEALRCGLVDFVVPDDELPEAAMKIAKKLASGPSAAYAADKRLFRMAANVPYEALFVAESDEISYTATLKDSHEGVSAMIEKRKPAFTGRPEKA